MLPGKLLFQDNDRDHTDSDHVDLAGGRGVTPRFHHHQPPATSPTVAVNVNVTSVSNHTLLRSKKRCLCLLLRSNIRLNIYIQH